MYDNIQSFPIMLFLIRQTFINKNIILVLIDIIYYTYISFNCLHKKLLQIKSKSPLARFVEILLFVLIMYIYISRTHQKYPLTNSFK